MIYVMRSIAKGFEFAKPEPKVMDEKKCPEGWGRIDHNGKFKKKMKEGSLRYFIDIIQFLGQLNC